MEHLAERPTCDRPLQTACKAGINFLNKISVNLLQTKESQMFSIFLLIFVTKVFCFLLFLVNQLIFCSRNLCLFFIFGKLTDTLFKKLMLILWGQFVVDIHKCKVPGSNPRWSVDFFH